MTIDEVESTSTNSPMYVCNERLSRKTLFISV